MIKIKYSPQDYQREVHDDPTRFKVIIRGRRGGKTEEEIQDTVKLAVTNPGLHWITGPTFRQIKSIIWTRLKIVLRVDPDWKFNEQELYAQHAHIQNSNGEYTRIELKGVDNEDSLVGVGLRSLKCDEAALYRPNIWPQILRPMLADHKAPASFYTTPRGSNWLHDLYKRGIDPNEPNWKSWKESSYINKYISKEEIEEMKRDMPHRLFLQEVMAEFLDEQSGVFRKVTRCTVGELQDPVLGRFYVGGVDLGRTHDFTVITILDSVTRGVVYFERFTDIEWKEQKLRIQDAARKYNNALMFIDSTGAGDPIYEDLLQSGVSCESFKFNNSSKAALVKQGEIAIEERQVTWPRELEVLTREVKDYEYTLSVKGNVIYGAPEGKFDDCVISLLLAIWGIRNQLREAQIVQADNILLSPQDKQGLGELVSDEEEQLQEIGGY